MAVSVRIVDEVKPGRRDTGWELELPHERITAREVIRSRVYQEVTEYNARASGLFRGLVQPSEAEMVLNGFQLKAGRRIDWSIQYEKRSTPLAITASYCCSMTASSRTSTRKRNSIRTAS